MATDGPNMAKDDSKMAQTWAKRASRWPQDGSAQAFGAILGYLWAILGPFRGQLRAILGHFGVKMHFRSKSSIFRWFSNDFHVTCEPSWGHVGSILALLGTTLGHFGVLLGHLGALWV